MASVITRSPSLAHPPWPRAGAYARRVAERRDVVRNRARIVAAAEEVFREFGAAVALDQVAVRAGVGRGTLYRHFPDRAALVAAVYERRVAALEEYASGLEPPTALVHLVVEMTELLVDAPGLFTVMRAAADGPGRLEDVERRARVLLGTALDAAREHGRVRDDVTLDDVLLIIAMVEGVIAMEPPDVMPAAVHRTVEIVLRGLLTDTGAAEPLPRPELRLPAQEE